MSNKTKYLMYRFVAPVVIFAFVWFMMQTANPDMKWGIKLFITGSIAYIISPKVKIISFMHGQNVQVKWFLIGKVILFPLEDK